MSSSAKNPIVIESDDEDEEVVYLGTTQGAPKGGLVHTCEGSCEVVDVEALEPYVIDVEEQPDSQGFPAPAGGSLEQDLLDISQTNMAPPNSSDGALLASDDLDLSSLGSTDPLASLGPGSFPLNSTSIDLDSPTLARHGSSAMGIVSCPPSGRTDLAHNTHGPADLTSNIIDSSVSSSTDSHVVGTGCDLDVTTLMGGAGQNFSASSVLQAQNSGAPLTSADSSAQGFGAASLSYNPLAQSFTSQSDAAYSGSSSRNQSLQSQDANSALDLRPQAVDLSIPRTDLNSLSSSNNSLDQRFPDSMSIFPSFYMNDDIGQNSSLLGGRIMNGTSRPDDSKSLLKGKGDLQCQPVTSGSPPPLVSATMSPSVNPSQSLPMATNAACSQATPVSVPNPAQWQTGLISSLVSSDGQASDKVMMPSTSSALPLLMQSSVAHTGTPTAAGQQSTSTSQFGMVTPGSFQPALSIQVNNAQVPALSSLGGIICSGFGPVPSGPSLASSLPDSCTLVAPAVAQGSASTAGLVPDSTKTSTIALDPLSSAPRVILSNSASGSVQMAPVVTDAMVVLPSTVAASSSLPVGLLAAVPLGSATCSQASGLCGPVGISAQPLSQPLFVYPTPQPASSSPKWGSPAIGQNSAVISPPSLSASTSSSTSPPAASATVTNASTSGHNFTTDASRSIGAPPVLPSFGDLSGSLNSINQGDLLDKAFQGLCSGPDQSSAGKPSSTGQSSVLSGASGTGLMDVATSVVDPSKPQGVDEPCSPGLRRLLNRFENTVKQALNPVSLPSLQTQPFTCVVTPATSAQIPLTSNSGRLAPVASLDNSSSSNGGIAGVLQPPGVSSMPFALGMAVGLTAPGQGGSSLSQSNGTSSQQLSLAYSPMAAIPLPPRKRKYVDTSLGAASSSSGGPNPSKRLRGWERNLCAGCSVATEDRDQMLQCPFGHLACSTCLQRQNVLFLQNKVKKLSCFDVTCSYVFGNHTVAIYVKSLGEDKGKTKGDDNQGFVTSDVNKSLEVPIHWEPMKSEPKERYKLVDLPLDSSEYKHVKAMFQKSLKFRIKKISRVQNLVLWRYYNMKKLEMTNEQQDNVDERLLFHGTKDAQVLQNICAKGFDWRYSGRHGTLYGQGSYFAVRADYSHQYCTRSRFRSSSLLYMAHQSQPLNSFSRLLGRSPLAPGPTLAPFALTPTTGFHLLGTPSLLATPSQTLTQSSARKNSFFGSVGGAAGGSSGSHDGSGGGGSSSSSSSSSSYLPQFMGTHPPKTPSGSGGPGLGGVGANPLRFTQLSLLDQITKRRRTFNANVWSNHGLLGTSWSGLSGGSSSSASSSSAASSSAPSSSAPSSLGPPSSSSSSSQQSAPLGPLPPPPPPLPDSTSSEDKGPTLRMLLAKVLVGKYTRGTKEMRKPPPLNEDHPFGKDYDSCVDHLLEPTIHVVFDSKQTYPMWVIEYVEDYD